MADTSTPTTVPIPEGAMEQAPAAPQTVAIPEGASLGAPTQANANVGGGAPLSEAEAKQDQASPGGSYATNQARLNAPAKDPDHVRFKASDGSIHDVPKEHLTKAVQIDPKLQIIDWPTGELGPNDPDETAISLGEGGAGVPIRGTHVEVQKARDEWTAGQKRNLELAGAALGGEAGAALLPETGGGLVAGAGRLLGKAATTGAGAAAGNAAGQAAAKGEVDPAEAATTGAEYGALEGAGAALGKGAKAVKNLVSGGASDVSVQGLKDMIKSASGAKDPDVIDAIHSVLDKPKMFSTVENELKLAKPKLEEMKDAANEELKSLRESSTGTIKGAKTATHVMFDDLIQKAGDVLESDKIKDGIYEIRDFVGPKLSNDDMTFKELNDVKNKIDKEIKSFNAVKPGQSQVVNTIDKAKQDALHEAREFIQKLENKAEPAAADVNKRLSTLIDTTDALNKKFPHLDTAEKAEASYEAGKGEAKKDAAKKVGLATVGGGIATGVGAGIKSAVDNMSRK